MSFYEKELLSVPSMLSFSFFLSRDYGSGGSVGGTGRRRLGTSTRDYTVFTINWWSNGARLQAGSTYSNRGYYAATNLGSVEATAEGLLPDVAIDEIGQEEWTPRNVDIWELGQTFVVVTASSAGGNSTTCDSTATLACSGTSTPSANRVPFFYITCGPQHHFGPDPYHFTPDFGAAFPAHGEFVQ